MISRRLDFQRLLVQRGDTVTQLAHLRLLRLGLGGFLLSHQRADFLRRPVTPGLERFNLCEQLPPLLVELEQLVNASFIPCPARGKACARKIRLIANQFNIEHWRNYRN